MEHRMAAPMTIEWDREGDILSIHSGLPVTPEQETDFIEDDIVVRYDPDTGEVVRIDVLFFSQNFHKLEDRLELPILGRLSIPLPVAQEA